MGRATAAQVLELGAVARDSLHCQQAVHVHGLAGFVAAFTEGPIDFYKSQIQVQIIRSKTDPNYKRECKSRRQWLAWVQLPAGQWQAVVLTSAAQNACAWSRAFVLISWICG